MLRVFALSSLAQFAAGAATCGEVKDFYKAEQCCGHADQALSSSPPGCAACPYNFDKPQCEMAEPQAPRDLSEGAEGFMVPKATTLNAMQAQHLPLVNVHFHLGAEHKSNAYSDSHLSEEYDQAHGSRRRLSEEAAVRPGFMCHMDGNHSDAQLEPYEFQYCQGEMMVGASYEVHYVHSSAGYTAEDLEGTDMDGIEDGLGGAANGRGQLNPMIVVQAQIYQIIQGAADYEDMVHGLNHNSPDNMVMYAGSTTGTSHDNEICSPYAISWHVDKACHQVSPEAFDRMCKVMHDEYGLNVDLHPHGSRILVDSRFVVPSEYVMPMM